MYIRWRWRLKERKKERKREREKCKYLNLHAPFLFACFCRERGGRDGDERPTCEGYSDLGQADDGRLGSLHGAKWQIWAHIPHLEAAGFEQTGYILGDLVLKHARGWTPRFFGFSQRCETMIDRICLQSYLLAVLRFAFRAGTANKTEPLPHSCSKSTELGCHRIWCYEWRWPSGPL